MPKIRTTVPIEADALAVFQRMAEVMGKSVGATIGEWIAETADQAELVTVALMKAKSSPARALRELQAIAEAAQTRIGEAQAEMAELQRTRPAKASPGSVKPGADVTRSAAAAPGRRKAAR